MPKQAESLPDSPDALLRFCDGELHRLRAKRASATQHRAVVLGVSILVLVIGAFAAFFLLFTRLQDLPRPAHRETPAEVAPSPTLPVSPSLPPPAPSR